MKTFSPLGVASLLFSIENATANINVKTANINTKKLSSLQRKLMTKNDTSKTANMKWDGSV
jgi:hypothetical protein